MADKKTTLMAQFYEQCQTKGYTNMGDATQSLKAKVIASDLKLNYGDIVQFYAKAQTCYDQVQAEKAETEQKAEIERKAAEEEAARRAVSGELLVSISDSEKSRTTDEAVIRVYVRPDGSLYSAMKGGKKIEGVPAIEVTKGGVLTTTYHPSQAVYTGATVGGITTGGIHYTKAGYSEKMSGTGTGDVSVRMGETAFAVKRITASPLVKNRFKRDPDFKRLAQNGTIQCFKESTAADALLDTAMSQASDYATRMNLLSMAVDKKRLPYNTCADIADLLARMVNAQFPPSDEELYAAAEALAEKTTSAEMKRAAETFKSIADYRDADQQAKEAAAKYEELLQEEKEQAILKKEAAVKTTKKVAAIGLSLAAAVIVAVAVMIKIVIPNGKYNNAVTLMDAGKYDEAIAAFEAIRDHKDSGAKIADCIYAKADALMEAGNYGEAIAAFEKIDGYKDSVNKIVECNTAILDKKYGEALGLLTEGKGMQAMLLFGSLGDHKDSRAQSFSLWDRYAVRAAVSATYHTVGLRTDGTVTAVGSNDHGQCEVSDWKDIVAVSAGNAHTVGLKADGTVVAVGDNDRGQCDVSAWRDIVAVSAGKYHTMGLKADGTVVAAGDDDYGRDEVSAWRDITAISAGPNYMVGLKIDGTVVAAGDNKYDQCEVSNWQDITAISAGRNYTVGLRADGTVVAVGENEYDKCNVSGWSGIVAISAGETHTVGLTADGKIMTAGRNNLGQLDVSGWSDIVAAEPGIVHTVGLKADGTLAAAGSDYYGQCNVSDWTDIRLPKDGRY